MIKNGECLFCVDLNPVLQRLRIVICAGSAGGVGPCFNALKQYLRGHIQVDRYIELNQD